MKQREVVRLVQARRLASTGEARAIRLAAELSLREVADTVGVSVTCLWRWENARRAPQGQPAVFYAELLEQLRAELTEHRVEVDHVSA
jgi:DNA-binding transcriptional regulator YiaG